MACNARQVLADGIGFSGLPTPALKAAQLQLATDMLLALDPTSDVTVSALLAKAKANGLCCLTRRQLRQFSAQILCEIRESL
jgi:hypothetical protein